MPRIASTTNSQYLYTPKFVEQNPLGIVSRRRLVADGASSGTIDRWIRNGRLRPVFPGIYALGSVDLSRDAHLFAAQLAVGHGAHLDGWSALEKHGILPQGYSSVWVTSPNRVRRIRGIRHGMTSSLAAASPRTIGVFRVVGVPHALCRIAHSVEPTRLARLIHEGMYRDVVSIGELDAYLAAARGRRGIAILRNAIELIRMGSAGTRSSLERRVLTLIASTALPMPQVNVLVRVASGLEIEVDMYWSAHRLCVEIDGAGHRRLATRHDDANRDELLRASGHNVLRISDSDVVKNPRSVLASLAALLAD